MARSILSALAMVVSLAVPGSALAAALHEGVWIGGLQTSSGPIFMRLVLGGEGSTVAGRADFPMKHEWSILLRNVSVRGTKVRFDVPGDQDDVRFEGEIVGDRLEGDVRQGTGTAGFELLRATLNNSDGFREIVGDFEFAPGQVGLLYEAPNGPMYVDYRNGRTGQLYRLSDGRYVGGPTVASGYPVEVEVTPERDVEGRVVAVTWSSRGERARGVRRTLYREEPAVYWNGDVKLAGTLLLPHGPGPHPAVVLIQGTGATTRNVLLPLADVFARNGIAALVSDRRGSGESTGSQARAGFDVLAEDALAAVRWLKGRPEINARQIGMQGGSLGGWIAPLAASRSRDVAFVIVEAAPATSPAEHERQRVERQMRADGQPREKIALASIYMEEKFEVGRTGKGWDALMEFTKQAERERWLRYVNPPSTLENLQWNWEYILSYDPRPALESLTCPVLALYGERDTIVSPEVHLARMRDALARSGNRDTTVQQIAGANHHFLSAETGGPEENATLSGFVEGYFETGVSWLRSRVDATSGEVALSSGLIESAR